MIASGPPALGTVHWQGLTSEEAADARRRYGPNAIARGRRIPAALVWLLRIGSDPMALLLLVAAATYTALGDRVDAIVSAVALVPIVAVGIVLEGRADTALARLRALTAPRARVIRDAREREVDAKEVVPGDLLVVMEGDVVAADAELVDGHLALDESALTGESLPVERRADEGREICSGTIAVGGRGIARVTAIGASTRYGRIAAMLGTLRPPRTPIETAIRALVARLGGAVLAICVAVVLIERGHGTPWTVALIAAISLAMAAIPEELPMVYTLYLALGAWRLTRDRALVRRLASVETLGSVSTICVDKTGTLTFGTVELADVVPFGDATRDAVLAAALLACGSSADPIDAAFARAAHVDLRAGGILLEDEPYDARRRYAAKRWRLDGRVQYAAKGALETLFALTRPTAETRASIQTANDALARAGMRVLAVAAAENGEDARIIGLAGFRDPVRPDAPDALAACRAASVRVVMITGDHPATARAVARAVGFGDNADLLVTGDVLDTTSEDALPAFVAGARVFARIRPEQKLMIVRGLRRNGDVVAMTGDGTNDALALREADIGIAMGRRGTEVAREAAGLVLLDDDISTIVRAIRNGRRIFENLRRAFGYLIGFHAPLLVAAIALPVAGLPLLLQPVHLVWLELIVHPTSSLVFESDPADRRQMQRPPRRRSEPFLRRVDWVRPVTLGLTLAAAVVGIYAFALSQRSATEAARAEALIALLVGQTLLVFVQRSPDRPFWRGPRPTPVALALAGGALASLLLALVVPPLETLLHLAEPSPTLALAAAAAGALATLWWEPLKR